MTRLRPMLVTFQYGAREITSLSVSEWHHGESVAFRPGPRHAGPHSSQAIASGATPAGTSTSASKPTSTRLCLVNCVGSDVLGILQLSYKKDVLVMLNLVQTIPNPNRYLPLQSLFCCGKFVVSATEEAPRVVKVHVLGTAKQGGLVDAGTGAVMMSGTFNTLPYNSSSSPLEQQELVPTSQGMLHNGLSCQGNVISETRTLTFARAQGSCEEQGADVGGGFYADLFSSYGAGSSVSETDKLHSGREEAGAESVLRENSNARATDTSRSADTSPEKLVQPGDAENCREDRAGGSPGKQEDHFEDPSARISVGDHIIPAARKESPPGSLRSSPAASPAKSDAGGHQGVLVRESPGLRISQHNVDLGAVEGADNCADGASSCAKSPSHRPKTNNRSIARMNGVGGAPSTPPSTGKKSSHTSSAPSLSPRISPRRDKTSVNSATTTSGAAVMITKKIDNDPPAAYTAMAAQQTKNNVLNGTSPRTAAASSRMKIDKHTLSQPVLGARTTSQDKNKTGAGTNTLVSPVATTATTTPVTAATTTPTDGTNFQMMAPPVVGQDQLARAVAEAKSKRTDERNYDTDDTSSISTMNAGDRDRAVEFELENSSKEDREDEYGLCLAVNESATLLAIGDTTGGVSLVRRTTCRRKPDAGVYSY
eukprot:g9440.t1